MALGACRHCGAHGIPIDAPLCRVCGGWRPNPGWSLRMGVVVTRFFAAFFLAIGLALCSFLAWLTLATGDMGFLGFLGIMLAFVVGNCSVLLTSLIRPYGREVSEQ